MGKVKSDAARCAQEIRSELKDKFPATKFRVKSKTYSMGDSVSVYWDDGPTSKQVENIINKHQYGWFDGMADLYIQNNMRSDITQVKFVFAYRDYTVDTKKAVVELIQRKWGVSIPYNIAYAEWKGRDDLQVNGTDTIPKLGKTAYQLLQEEASKIDFSNNG